MDVPANNTLGANAHTFPVKAMQKQQRSLIGDAVFHSKCVRPSDAATFIKINTSHRLKVSLPGIRKRTVFKFIPFEIKGVRFNWINGNVKDDLVSELIRQETSGGISFQVENSAGCFYHTPSQKWQERFLRCINEGMMDFIETQPSDVIVPYTGGMTGFDLYGGTVSPPTCNEFVKFLMYNSTSYKDEFIANLQLLESTGPDRNFIGMGLLDDDHLIHEFIYIGGGVCVGKLGAGMIFFHTIDDVCHFYMENLEKSLKVVTVNRLDVKTTSMIHASFVGGNSNHLIEEEGQGSVSGGQKKPREVHEITIFSPPEDNCYVQYLRPLFVRICPYLHHVIRQLYSTLTGQNT